MRTIVIRRAGRAAMGIVAAMLVMVACCMMLGGCSSSHKSSVGKGESASVSAAAGDSAQSVSSAATDGASAASESNASAQQAQKTESKSADEGGVVVPDLVGQNLGDVKGQLKNFDVDYVKADGSKANVFMKSNWRIDQQSLEAGTTVQKGAKLVLTLGHLTEEKAAADKAAAEAAKAEERAQIDYTSVSVGQLIDDLDANAMNAKETYKDGYFRITGVVSNIDASGKYISLDPEDALFNFTNVMCYLNDDTTRESVRHLSKGDTVTLCGQVTDVGEVLGYSVDVYFFE